MLSSNFDTTACKTALEEVFVKNELMGMSVILLADNQIVYEDYFGQADSARQIPITDATMYRIASISKSITATAVLQLVEQNKLDLDNDVNRYLGWSLRNPKHPTVPITLRSLMSHQSSIRDSRTYEIFAANMVKDQLPIWDLLSIKGAYFADNAFDDRAPGDYFYYTNCTWGIVASIIEKVSGERFDRYCKKHILEPLGMKASFNLQDIKNIDDLAVLYRYQNDQWTPQVDHHQGKLPASQFYKNYQLGANGLLFAPQGGLRSSAKDLATFGLMLMNDGSWNEHQILKPQSVQQLTSPTWLYDGTNGYHWENFIFSYGLGIHQTTNRDSSDIVFPDRKMIGHAGNAYGLLSDLFVHPATKSGIVFLMNGSKQSFENGPTSAFYQVEEDVFNAVFPYLKK